MEKGFIIEVFNNKESEQEIHLFSENGLREGVTVKVFNSDLDYQFLLNIAQKEGFKGNGFQIDSHLVTSINIHDGENFEKAVFKRVLYPKKIILNGFTKYISLVIPQQAVMVIQLFTIE